MINPQDAYKRRTVPVFGRKMAYVDEGKGPAVVFLHGNAVHSFYWRNLIRYLTKQHRCIAPDWLGMGESDLRIPSGAATYTFRERGTDLEIFLQLIEPGRSVVLVGHEMGALQALEWARRHEHVVRGLVLIEGAFRLTNTDTWDPGIQDLVFDVRSDLGEDLVLRENVIIEQYLPSLVERKLTRGEHQRYLEPFSLPGEGRRAMLTMMRELPLRQHPGPIDEIAEELRMWCSESYVPKLVIGGTPGHLTPPAVLGAAARWRASQVEAVAGRHFLLEDSPAAITAVVREWLAELPSFKS